MQCRDCRFLFLALQIPLLLFLREIIANRVCEVVHRFDHYRNCSTKYWQKTHTGNGGTLSSRVLEQPKLGGVGMRLGIGLITGLLGIYDSQNQLFSSPVHIVRSYLQARKQCH